MKISEIVLRYAQNRKLKGKLTQDISLNTDVVLKKGTVSTILVDKGDGTFHFEVGDDAFSAQQEDFEFVE